MGILWFRVNDPPMVGGSSETLSPHPGQPQGDPGRFFSFSPHSPHSPAVASSGAGRIPDGKTAGGWGFRFQVSGFRFQVSGFRFQVSGSGFRVQGSGFRVQGSGFRFRFRVQGSGFRVQGSGFRGSGV